MTWISIDRLVVVVGFALVAAFFDVSSEPGFRAADCCGPSAGVSTVTASDDDRTSPSAAMNRVAEAIVPPQMNSSATNHASQRLLPVIVLLL